MQRLCTYFQLCYGRYVSSRDIFYAAFMVSLPTAITSLRVYALSRNNVSATLVVAILIFPQIAFNMVSASTMWLVVLADGADSTTLQQRAREPNRYSPAPSSTTYHMIL